MFTDKYINEGRTKLEEGDVVECVKSRDDQFIIGKEYKVRIDDSGNSRIITESLHKFYLRPKQGGYYSTNTEKHWFRKKENVMDKEFKAGDWVFEISHKEGIHLTKISSANNPTFPLRGKLMCYITDGRFYPETELPHLLHATLENRQALVTLYGERAVPKLELTGGEAVKHLLKSQKYVLCWVSDDSEAHAREGNVVALIDCADTILPFGSFYDGGDDWDYAVPIDMNGDELTISLVGWD